MAGENPRSDDDTQGRERRLQALRALAQQQASETVDAGPAESPATRAAGAAPDVPARGQHAPQAGFAENAARPRQPRRRGRLWIVALSAALCVVVAGGVALRAFAGGTSHPAPPAHSPHPAAPDTVNIPILSYGTACPSAIAWSSDGKHVAVVGYMYACPSAFPTNYQYEPGIVSVYDTATGNLVYTFQPDMPVQRAPGVISTTSPADTSSQIVSYSDVLWSPDGKKLVLRFAVGTYSTVQASFGATVKNQGSVTGLEVVNADGSQPRVITYNAHGSDYGALRWDLTAGRATPISSPLSGQPVHSSTALASSYSWSSDDTLQPGTPLTNGATATLPLGPIGNPDGGSSFSIWQPGTATYQNEAFIINQAVPEDPGAYRYSADILAWSPDGRYIFDSVVLDGLVQPQGRQAPSAKALRDLGLDTAPHLPMHDAGMEQAFESLPTNGSGVVSLSLAWRPDGRVLAAQTPSQDPSHASDTTVTFYDSGSGAKLATLTLASNVQNSDEGTTGNSALAWSPDGLHLLALDAQSGAITIWSGGKLPK